MRAVAVLILCLASTAAQARPSPYPVTQFDGDRYSARVAQGGMHPNDVTRAVRSKRAHPRAGKRWRGPVPVPQRDPRPRPGVVAPLGMLGGVVPPLAAKAREIVASCGSVVISGIRHTRIAGTGGRLSLHASGRAVDIKGNPACIASHLRGWPGGASTDYSAVQHTHISYAPGGPEWGVRFAHYRGGHRKRHKHRRRA